MGASQSTPKWRPALRARCDEAACQRGGQQQERGGDAEIGIDASGRSASYDCRATICGPADSTYTDKQPCAPGHAAAPRRHAAASATLRQVHELQNALAAVSDAPGLGLSEAAELLHAELDAALIGIYGFCRDDTGGSCDAPAGGDGDGWCAVLLAACGQGEALLEAAPVVTDPRASPLRLRASAADCLPAAAADGAGGAGGPLPADWSALASACGLRSFLAVPIGPPSKPWGALLVAKEAPHGLAGPGWPAWLAMAAVALVHQVRHWQTAAVMGVLREAAAAEDPIGFIGAIIRGAASLVERSVNVSVGARLAVMDRLATKALIFEPAAGAAQGAPGPAAAPALVALEMSTIDTLLASAASMRKARFVRDCTSYMQSSAHPARDVYTQPSRLVASLVVVPFVYCEDAPIAALYLTLEAPNTFAALQQPLLGFVNSVNALVNHKLRAGLDRVWAEAAAVRCAPARSAASTTSIGSLATSAAATGPGGCGCGARSASAVGAGDTQESLLVIGGASSGGAAEPQPAAWTAAAPGGGGGGGGAGPAAAQTSGLLARRAASMTLSRVGSGALGGELSACGAKRLGTGSMLKAVEQEIFKCKRLLADAESAGHVVSSSSLLSSAANCASAPLLATRNMTSAGPGSATAVVSAPASDEECASLLAAPGTPPGAAGAPGELALSRLIGLGGYGTVWCGTWRKVTAAIKVMYHRRTEQEALMDAIEMAVLSTVSHPHVVRAYACFTDMVEVTDAPQPALTGAGPAESAPLPRPSAPHYRRLLPFEDPGGAEACSIIVMEYCDLGTLRRAAQRGAFHRPLLLRPGPDVAAQPGMPGGPLPAGSIGVDMAALVEVALEVAEAVAYLHSIRLCHCDIKLDNVLLKSEVSQPRGYIVKLADYGLAKVLGAGGGPAINVTCAGTVTHLAPELFTPGSRVTPAVDAYAFGVLLYELYMGGASAYAGLSKAAIIERVAAAGMRPRFPSSAPREYAAVARACWAADPAARPAFPQIISALEQMQARMASPAAAASWAAGC